MAEPGEDIMERWVWLGSTFLWGTGEPSRTEGILGAACKRGLGILSQMGAGGHFSPLLGQRQAVWICLQCASFRFPQVVVDIIYFHPSGEHRCKTDQHGGATVNDEPPVSNTISLHFTPISGMASVTHFTWCLYIEQHHFCAMCCVCLCWLGSLVLSGKKLY